MADLESWPLGAAAALAVLLSAGAAEARPATQFSLIERELGFEQCLDRARATLQAEAFQLDPGAADSVTGVSPAYSVAITCTPLGRHVMIEIFTAADRGTDPVELHARLLGAFDAGAPGADAGGAGSEGGQTTSAAASATATEGGTAEGAMAGGETAGLPDLGPPLPPPAEPGPAAPGPEVAGAATAGGATAGGAAAGAVALGPAEAEPAPPGAALPEPAPPGPAEAEPAPPGPAASDSPGVGAGESEPALSENAAASGGSGPSDEPEVSATQEAHVTGADLAGATRWSTDFGDLVFGPLQTGTVTGREQTGAGYIVGRLDDRTLIGRWVRDDGGERCTTAFDGSRHWGLLEFVFESDFAGFIGRFGFCDGPLNRPWSGTLAESSEGGEPPKP